ncbi:cyclic lactone autoinducer peptide [Cohnella sp. OV330]|uniref:Cyclic lactone autoinducer peptide n=1 Tax=Cohnella hashimotonis TaxID=2826895 RepID=A0ABT6TF73_9BACL|nr:MULTISPECIES: cyclic lactone autoinducer peptide [Cohnella]MDI4645480.1 cyclic lactone autoinducer peptide [Cohnella hashimotonis]SFB18370.1 cyclic lactone autoinducer peptide [Cohnella sp. OV330]
MKKRAYSVVGSLLVAVASLFAFTGCYVFLNKPTMPKELRR